MFDDHIRIHNLSKLQLGTFLLLQGKFGIGYSDKEYEESVDTCIKVAKMVLNKTRDIEKEEQQKK